MDGILLVDKPKGLSSAAVVAQIKKKFAVSKVGHGGTLDPMATGLLPIAVNEGTKILSFLLDADKEYIAELTLGISTDTDDAEGSTTKTSDASHITREQIQSALAAQVGVIQQRPPVYSALKRGGTPLYKLARQGQEVETEPRSVEVKEIELLSFEPPRATFRVACGKGTYIRSIARDVGESLGCGAHLSALRRTKAHRFDVQNAKSIELISSSDALPCVDVLSFLPSIKVDEAMAKKVFNGLKMPASQVGFSPSQTGHGCVLSLSGELLAIASLDGADGLSWQRVFHAKDD